MERSRIHKQKNGHRPSPSPHLTPEKPKSSDFVRACMQSHFSHVQLFETLWPVDLPDSSVLGILRARMLERMLCPSPGDLPDPGIKPASPVAPALQFFTEPLGKPLPTSSPAVSPSHPGGAADQKGWCCRSFLPQRPQSVVVEAGAAEGEKVLPAQGHQLQLCRLYMTQGAHSSET